MEANDDDFCERLPGQHTGRLSLELQASEAAEWKRRIEELESENRRLTKLMNHFRDVIAEYHDMALTDIEPEPSPPAESPDAVVGTADRLRRFSEQLESGETIKATRIERHETPDGPMYVRTQTDMKPAESPDDWVTQDRVPARVALDEYRVSGSQSEPGVWKRCIYGTFPIVHGYQHGRPLITGTGNSTLELRCRRKDLPVVPAETPAQQPSCSPVCALCGNIATCFGQYADHDKGFACDSCCGHGNEDGWCMTIGEYDHQNSAPSVHSPSLPSPWRPMTEVPNCDWFWLAWNDGQVILSRDRSHWNLRSAVAWMPVDTPLHPNSAPADKPRMRQVTLSEYRHTNDEFAWTSCSGYLPLWTGRTAVVEVQE